MAEVAAGAVLGLRVTTAESVEEIGRWIFVTATVMIAAARENETVTGIGIGATETLAAAAPP